MTSSVFKRFWAAVTGNQDAAPGDGPVQSKEARSADRELVTAYDGNGQERTLTRKDWRDKVLLPDLQRHWNDADALYRLILSGVNDGHAAFLEAASARLLEIDTSSERGNVMRGIVQLNNGQLDAAEATLRAGIAQAGATGTLLTNLAKVFAARSGDAAAEATLWEALQADPNQENGLGWWAAMQQERGGAPAWLDAMRTAAALPGSWRPQLWLAQHHLEQQDVAQAQALYVGVLAQGAFDRDALLTISADLGSHGQPALLLALVGPAFDEQHHNPMTGLNLLQACANLGKADEGEAILARMVALRNPVLAQHLDAFARTFQSIRAQDGEGTPPAIMNLTQPIWQYGLRQADWLFAPKPDGAPAIAFFAFSMLTGVPGAAGPQSARDDDLELITRAIPLYLAESAHYWSDYAASCYVEVKAGSGPVAATGASDADSLNALLDSVPATVRYVVTGDVDVNGKGEGVTWHVSLIVWERATRTKVASERMTARQAQFSEAVLVLEARLLDHIGLPRTQPLDAFYQRPPAGCMQHYLIELGQAFMLVLLAMRQVSTSSEWDERAMLDWPLDMAQDWPALEVPKLMAAAAIGRALSYESEIMLEYKERILRTVLAGGRAALLAPLMWKAFGMEDVLSTHLQGQQANADPAYLAWLERVAGTP